ncbi:S-adenosyl-L-methionine-dependent methyltransferase [Hyaloscypha hepaticicola]|uniref:S-adenosyl-L-methionine-dependent methyltransferase n=1 Tax=Hyaloscypha hepaticicola TaxID=2082293 RepID=A0A2J6Q1M6_9HELO|nr:S-adenosyl-L-methionine-dependent methyltransferase [Hyaloscypha hepaticicola]
MSGSKPQTGQGPPPFEPSIEHLASLSESIQASLAQYSSASNPAEKASALKAIQATSSKLSLATTPIPRRFNEILLRPYLNVTLRLVFEISLLETIPSNSPITIEEAASKVNTSEEFIFRLIRVLGAFEILEVLYPEEPNFGLISFSHTPTSRFLLSPLAKASFRHHFETMLPAQLGSVPGYYHKYGFKCPEDHKNVPFTFAHGTVDEGFFDILVKDADKLAIFNNAMAVMAVLGLTSLGSMYAFDQLVPNQDGIALVDIGGGKGQMLKAIQAAYPGMRGKLVLEDLKVVLDGGVVVDDDVVKIPYDFFKEVQPIKGSNYFLKSIFHDWPDKACLQILSNIAQAMRGHPLSKLLICELVLPDQYPEPMMAMRDINMLLIGGQERNLFQWNALLTQAGFKILKVHGVGGENSSIIEVVLNE